MSGTTKRLDLVFGAFGCSVQGFDDPVTPVQQILHALQNLLEETPELADASISFDADAIDRLIGEVARRADVNEASVDIVPGLVIVHRGEEDTVGAVTGRAAAAPPFETAEPAPPQEQAAPYVNIFAPAAGAEGEAEPAEYALGGDAVPEEESFGARLDRIAAEPVEANPFAPAGEAGDITGAEATPARDIFAEEDTAGGGVFADPMAAAPGGETEDGVAGFLASAPTEDADAVEPEPGGAEWGGAEWGDTEQGDTGGTEGLFGVPVSAEPDAAEAAPDEESPLADAPEEAPEEEAGRTAASLATAVGADTVSELMVAAAAWMVLLQGQTSFTRREVIKVFETIPGDHPKTLEARIKGFGKAVRNGQLVAIGDGVFGLARTQLERFESVL